MGRPGTFPALSKRAVSCAGQAPPACLDHTLLVNVRTVCSGKYWNCMVAVKTPELPHTDCGQDGNLLMLRVNHLETL